MNAKTIKKFYLAHKKCSHILKWYAEVIFSQAQFYFRCSLLMLYTKSLKKINLSFLLQLIFRSYVRIHYIHIIKKRSNCFKQLKYMQVHILNKVFYKITIKLWQKTTDSTNKKLCKTTSNLYTILVAGVITLLLLMPFLYPVLFFVHIKFYIQFWNERNYF